MIGEAPASRRKSASAFRVLLWKFQPQDVPWLQICSREAIIAPWIAGCTRTKEVCEDVSRVRSKLVDGGRLGTEDKTLERPEYLERTKGKNRWQQKKGRWKRELTLRNRKASVSEGILAVLNTIPLP